MDLITQWHMWKLQEAQAKQNRLDVENAILREFAGQLKDHGTSHIGTISITRDVERKWDNDFLSRVYESRGNKLFPFKFSFSEIRADSKYIEANEPDIWSSYVDGLTISPKKPSFKAREEK